MQENRFFSIFICQKGETTIDDGEALQTQISVKFSFHFSVAAFFGVVCVCVCVEMETLCGQELNEITVVSFAAAADAAAASERVHLFYFNV